MIRVSPLIGLLAATLTHAQQYVISTVAGGGPILRMPTPAVEVPIYPWGAAADDKGNFYFVSAGFVFKLDPAGLLTRIAGNHPVHPMPYSGDGGLAIDAPLAPSAGVAVDNKGDVFIAESRAARIRRVSPGGIITTVAGNGIRGFSGDGGPATDAQLNGPAGMAIDSTGNLFFAEVNRVRKVSPSGIITTVAGNGLPGYSGDGGPATSARLSTPYGIAVDGNGNFYISDHGNSCVRKVSSSGIITTVAGSGSFGFSGDGGPATNAQLNGTLAVAVDNAGNLFIDDHNNRRIRKVSPSGIITTVAGAGAGLGDGGLAKNAQVGPAAGLALDNAGNLFIADTGHLRIRKIGTDGIITTVAGTGGPMPGFSGDAGPATDAQLHPVAIVVDGAGSLFIADDLNHRVRKVSVSGIVTTVAGTGTAGFSGDGGPATSAQLDSPLNLAVDAMGNLFIVDNFRIRKVSPSGIITTVAGGGTLSGADANGEPATNARLNPWAVATDRAGDVFIADIYDSRIRKVSTDGIITTVAGNGTHGYSGDGGPATEAPVWGPNGVAVDTAGNLFITEYATNRVRKVTTDGIINTLIDGTTLGWTLTGPAVDAAGNLYFVTFCDCDASSFVRRLAPAGVITTVAGNGQTGYSGDGGLATNAQLIGPSDVAVDGAGNIYVADEEAAVVRILRPIERPVWISTVVDAASQKAAPVAPGKLVTIYGAGLGPAQLVSPPNQVSWELAGTAVYFNGTPTRILYSSATQVAAVIPDFLFVATAQITVAYQGELSDPFPVPALFSAPSLFTARQTGAGQAAALNADGSVNSAANPVKVGDSITLYATGEGFVSIPDPPYLTACDALLHPGLPVSVSIGGIQATVQCAGRRPDEAVMRVMVQVPNGVQPGGYVPVVLKVGDASTTPDAVWIAVSAN